MSDNIGVVAGKIWQYLNTHGATSISKMTKATAINKDEIQRGIGWLAKEGKLNIKVVGRTQVLSLR